MTEGAAATARATSLGAALRRLLRSLRAPRVPRLRRSSRYAIAPAATALAALVVETLLPRPAIAPFELFFVTVAATSWLAGLLPGLLALVLSALAGNYLFVEPSTGWAYSGPALAATGLFFVSGACVAALCASFRNAQLALQRSLAEVRRAEEDLHRAQAVAQTGSWRMDVRRDVLLWSDQTYAMFGMPRGSPLTYEAFLTTVHPDDRADVDRRWSAALRGEPYDIEHRIVVGGEVKWVHERAQLEVGADGTLLGGFGTVQDVTERKRAADALRAANEQLRDVDRNRRAFLAVLSHELRNPLAAIRNAFFVLERAPPGREPARRAVEVVGRQVGQLARLIDDLLDVTRIERGKVHLQRQPVELNDLAQRGAEDHGALFAASEVHLELSPAPEEVWVDGDRTRLAQVIGNLLQNAAKFTTPGGTTTLEVIADRAARQAILSVRDTGSGISPPLLPHLFEPFAQADTSLVRQKGGLGLGLALVKGLVEMHGGSVSGESDGEGRGATFTVRLPLEAAPDVGCAPSRRPGGVCRRVLVIEDNVDTADTLREALSMSGHVVEAAYAGPDGIEKARAFGPDVVLCDIGLPGMDGFEVARAMRADPVLGRASIIALTGYALPEDIAKAREAGFDGHLAKPPSLEELTALLARAPALRTGE